MKKVLAILALVILPIISHSQSWRSSNALKGENDISVLKALSDDEKNTIIFGTFQGELYPPGGLTVDSIGGTDYFVAKFDSLSNIIWIKSLGSTGNEFGRGDATIDNSGAIYITGSFLGDFYYTDTDFLTTDGLYDIFVAKIEKNGNINWCENYGAGAHHQFSSAIQIDKDLNILLAGTYFNDIDIKSDTTLSTNSFKDYFYAKFNSEGTLIWAKALKSINSNYAGFIYSFSPSDDYYILSGVYADSIDTGQDTIVSKTVNYYDTHVFKTDTAGNIDWIRKIKGDVWDYSYNSVLNTSDSSIYITGYYNSDSLLIDSTETNAVILKNKKDDYDFFIVKYDFDGNMQWAKSNGGNGEDRLLHSEYINNELHVTGYFADTMYWGGVELATEGISDRDMFYGVITPAGEYRGANQYTGKNSSTEQGYSLFTAGEDQYAVIRSDSELLTLGDSSYINTPKNYMIAVGVIGCLPITFDAVTPTDVNSCYGDSTGTISIDVSGGFEAPFQYSIDNGNTYQTSSTFNSLPAGTYQTTVIDAENCAQAGPEVTVSEPDEIVITDIDSVDAYCYGESNGSINVTATGGTGSLSYSIDGGSNFIQSVGSATSVAAGTYQLVVKDINNCQVTPDNDITIEQAAEISAALDDFTDAECFGGSNGTASITVTSDITGYTYLWDGQGTSHTATVEDPSNLKADIYDLTITDDSLCTKTFTSFATIDEPTEISLSDTIITDIDCFDTETGSISITPVNGTPALVGDAYTFNWTGPDGYTSTSQNITDLAEGDYSVTVTDSLLCAVTFGPFTISVLNSAIDTSAITGIDALCYDVDNGSASLTISGGASPYVVSWDGQTTAHNSTLENPNDLLADTYDLTISDANGCTRIFTSAVTIDEPDSISIIKAVNDVLCYGGSSGSIINTAVTGGTPFSSGDPYLYEWHDGTEVIATTQNINGVSAGDYTYTVTDANGCDGVFGPFTITEGTEITATLDSSFNVLCAGDTTGSAYITAAGGTGALNFEWNAQSSSYRVEVEEPDVLLADAYDLKIIDELGCDKTFSSIVTITEPTNITADTTITHVICYGASTGAIDLNPSGGTPFSIGEEYIYAWSGPNSFSASTQDVSGLPAGDYNVTVTDSTGCSEIFGPFTVEENPEIILTVNATSDLLCNGDDNGTADITASGGTGSFSYAWTGQNTGKTSDVEDPADLPADIYDLVITDGTDCSNSFASAVTISEPEVLAINSIDQVDVLCNGDNTGSFTINATGGTTPYLYSSDGIDFRSSAQFNNLESGTYSAVVRDKNDCEVTGSDVIISQPDPLVSSLSSKTDVVCYGENTGSLEVAASGGSAPYQYSIDGGNTNQDENGLFDALTADTYDVTITDANGCITEHSSINIAQPPAFDVIVNKTDVLCFGRDNGNFTLTGTGGTSPYEYSIDDGQTFTSTASYFFLEPDTFNIQVKDANGCLITGESVIINEPDSMEVNDVLVTDLKCFEEGTGSMLVRVKGGSKPYQYALNTGSFQTDSLFEELSTGAYSITVADAWGCVATGTASVSQPDQLLLETSSTEALCRGENTGTITATPSGGIPPYTYSPDSTEFVEDSVFTGFYAGKYTIHVLDSNNCHVKDTNVVVDPKDPLAVEIVSFTNVLPTEPGEIVAEASGGTAPYYYTLMPGNIEQTDNGTFEITRDNIGTYTVQVDDENGCGPVVTDEISIVGFAGSSLYREFSVYPNPTTGVVTIEFSTDNKEVELDLIGLDGKQLIEKKVYSSDGKVMEKINIGALEKGIYFIRLDNHAMPTGVVLK